MRLLVVEDDPDINRQLVTALQNAGYVVDSARDGEEGTIWATRNPMMPWCSISACPCSMA